jgi:protein-S-isoprenylcysteine O-methyltransferase Ste14
MSLKNLSLAAFLIAVLALGWLALHFQILGTGPVTIGLQVLAILLMIWARITFGLRSFHAAANPTEGGLVTTGPYHLMRHPIYAAVLLFAWAGIAAHLSWQTALFGLVITGGIVIRMLAEERLVVRQYPEYVEYARRTRRVLPWVF